jgi:glycosyltransferase involved in cell wall biosynthesis
MGFNGNIHFPGARADVPRLLQGAMDVFLFPSLWEGLPLSVIEAQAAGLPCVISDRVTREAIVLREQVEQLPLSATTDTWAAAALRQLREAKINAHEAAKAIAQTDFNVKNSSASLAELYASLTGHTLEEHVGGTR